MYLIHFFNAQGKYQVPVYREDVNAVLEVVFTYKDLVPAIRVTQADQAVFETDRGTVTWPELADDELVAMTRAYPPAAAASALDVLPGYVRAVDRVRSASADTLGLAFTQLRAAEIPLLAYAAGDGLNLSAHGYRPAESIITEVSELNHGS